MPEYCSNVHVSLTDVREVRCVQSIFLDFDLSRDSSFGIGRGASGESLGVLRGRTLTGDSV